MANRAGADWRLQRCRRPNLRHPCLHLFFISTTPNFGFGDFRAFYGVLPVRNGDKIGLFYVLFNFAIGMKTSTNILGSRPPIMKVGETRRKWSNFRPKSTLKFKTAFSFPSHGSILYIKSHSAVFI